MKYIIVTLLIFCTLISVRSQDIRQREGLVSFKSSQNIYVKFESTESIEIGDTLFVKIDDQLTPAIEVKHISSISCVGIPIAALTVDIGDLLIHLQIKTVKAPVSDNKPDTIATPASTLKNSAEETVATEDPKNKQSIRGRLTAGAHTYFSNTSSPPSTRTRYTFSMTANNLANSKFSIESYVIYRQRYKKGSEDQYDLANALKVYNLAVRFEPNDRTEITLGRKINNHISNIGAMDGLQIQRDFGQFTVGAISGSRPDLNDYGLNPSLFQYGGFVSHSSDPKKAHAQTSIAFLEQKNGGSIDRRFAYFQHSNALIKNINVFYSIEFDLFEIIDNTARNMVSPTSAYLSVRYRISRRLSLSSSYDARKNVIYYESYKNFIDDLIERESRQGLRFRFNYRPFKYVTVGSSAGYRFQKNNPFVSKNLYSFLTFSRVPWLKLSATLSSTLLETSYIKGGIHGIRISKDMLKGKLFGEMNYRFVNYKYGNSGTSLKQNIAGMNLNWRILKKLSFSVNYEGIFENRKTQNRMYVNLMHRF